jgi:hypothetical protein
LEKCDSLLAQVVGADHLAIRMVIQLGLRSEELFALRRNDVQGSGLVIDEAIVDGETKDTKTIASAHNDVSHSGSGIGVEAPPILAPGSSG